MAQKLLEKMLGTGLISVDEFNKITAKNRQTFSPFLSWRHRKLIMKITSNQMMSGSLPGCIMTKESAEQRKQRETGCFRWWLTVKKEKSNSLLQSPSAGLQGIPQTAWSW